jgi:eukaryotic-like serine/threonine-protein kinase
MTMWRDLQPDDPGQIGPYRLRAVLGAGGMGRVFLGASAEGQLAAVKVIRADLATDPEFRARFRREVTVARKVSGRFTVPLIGADADGPAPWLATAYVAGPSLADAVTEHGPLPVRSVLELATGLASGLTAIHAAGVVHRDLKPSNVLLAQDGPRVIDFGISVAAETSPLTRTGLLMGSPGYMSPEQVEGRPVGPASDIFSLGAVLVFAATGEAPFGSGSAPTLAYRAMYREVNLDRVPAEARGLIQRCLAKDPGQRPTARDLMFMGDPSRTVTSARLIPAAQPAAQPAVPPARPPAGGRPGRHQGRRHRRLARPLTIVSMVVGLLAASAAGGVALAASVHHSPGSPPRHAVSGQAVSGQAGAGPAKSPARPVPPTSSMSPAMTAAPPLSAPTTPVATPSMTTSAAASPTASSSAAPTATAPAPSGPAVPTPAAS